MLMQLPAFLRRSADDLYGYVNEQQEAYRQTHGQYMAKGVCFRSEAVFNVQSFGKC